MPIARHALVALSLMLAAAAAQAAQQPCIPEGRTAAGAVPCTSAAERAGAGLPWPKGLVFGMRQAEVARLSPAAQPRTRDAGWVQLGEDRMAVQLLAALVAGQEGMAGKSRLVEAVRVADVGLTAHYHFVMNRLTGVLAMPPDGWRAHETVMADHATISGWLTASHGQPRILRAPGRSARTQLLHSEWSLPDGSTAVLLVLPGARGQSLLGLGLRP